MASDLRFWVELLGRYSNWTNWAKQVEQAATSQRRVTNVLALHSIVRKLTTDQVDTLVEGYESGATVYELARLFKINRVTVSAHLHRQGIKMRGCGLTDEQIIQAAKLYSAGWSVARIGERFGVDGTTVWRELRQVGVPMRKTYERKSSPPRN